MLTVSTRGHCIHRCYVTEIEIRQMAKPLIKNFPYMFCFMIIHNSARHVVGLSSSITSTSGLNRQSRQITRRELHRNYKSFSGGGWDDDGGRGRKGNILTKYTGDADDHCTAAVVVIFPERNFPSVIIRPPEYKQLGSFHKRHPWNLLTNRQSYHISID